MDREEAIKIVRENMHLSYDKGNIFEVCERHITRKRTASQQKLLTFLRSAKQ